MKEIDQYYTDNGSINSSNSSKNDINTYNIYKILHLIFMQCICNQVWHLRSCFFQK